ncbi:hypothetical protein CEXT_351251 [Caerostris extrusa]|uniref:Uncharacterized protein n=1 Tax=Caerostris extrusa TaxID=172846 RepID=A0AAV4SG77_CAEEX|nr:hypothetical protein CEXT_351251 [Caerostris extrusa]
MKFFFIQKTLQFFDCTNRYIETCEKDIRELALLDELLTERMTLSYVTLEKLAREICDENSTLHEGYVDSIDCFRDFLTTVNSVCSEESQPVEAKILEILRFVKDEDELYPSAECLQLSLIAKPLKPHEVGSEGCLQLIVADEGRLTSSLKWIFWIEDSQKGGIQIAFDLVRGSDEYFSIKRKLLKKKQMFENLLSLL